MKTKKSLIFLFALLFLSVNVFSQKGESNFKSLKISKKPEKIMRGAGDPLKGLNVSDAKKEMQIGDYYALIVGIDQYSGEWDPLRNAVRDAKTVEQVLKTKYKFDHFITLYDDNATRTNIMNELDWLVENVSEKDKGLAYCLQNNMHSVFVRTYQGCYKPNL